MSDQTDAADLLRLTTHIVEQWVVPTFMVDTDGRLLAWNRACENLTGMPAALAMGGAHRQAFSSADRPCLAELLAQGRMSDIARLFPRHREVPGTSPGVHAECWMEMPLRGMERYLAIDASPVRDPAGRLLAVLESLHDATEHERANARFRRLFESSPDPVWIIEGNRFVDCNDAAVAMLGYRSRHELLNTHPSQLSPSHQPDGAGSFEKAERMMAIAAEQGLHRFHWVHQRADGTLFDAEVTLARIELEGQPAIYCTWRDISDRRQAEEALRLYATVFQHSGEALLITDADNRIVTANAALTRDSGYGLDEIRGRNPSLFASGLTPRETYVELWKALAEQGYWQGEMWDKRKDGSVFAKWAAITAVRDPEGRVRNYIAAYTDMSQRREAEARIDYLAHHDALTGLLNRHSLEHRLEQALYTARRDDTAVATVFLDLDRFKLVNDTLGHFVGDLLLGEVAKRLGGALRESDVVARLGGDEFVIALTGLSRSADAVPVVQKLHLLLSEPYHLAERVLDVTASLGVSLFPDDGQDVEALMKQADVALYHAKELGRNNYQFFTAAMTLRATERLELERDLRQALKLRQFELHYQPQHLLADGSLCGMEALLRWRHPSRGLVPPLAFITVAEESGLIEALGEWVIDEACRQLAAWRARGHGPQRVAVNVSVQQLRSDKLLEHVGAALQRHGLEGEALELEVTESAAMSKPEEAIERLRALRALGLRLALDDFGTGYSSLTYLKLLPIQTLKLDRSFVHDLESNDNSAAICAATLALAHTLGYAVVGEGVETPAQQEFLRRHGCDMLQGFLLGHPMPAEHWDAVWELAS